ALAASEERYRILYDSMSQGVVEFDAKGRIVSSNRAAREISGIDIEKLNGVSMAEVFAMIPEACREDGTPFTDDTVPAYLSLATGREVKNTIVRIMAPGRQNYLWVSHDVIPWFEPGQDNPGGMFIIFSDITKLKNIQEPLLLVNEDLERKILDKTAQLRKTIRVLENQKETLERVFNNIPVMLIFYDPSQNVRMVNREFERLTGWSPDDGETRDLMAASFPDPRQRREVWRFMISAKGIWREFEITTRSGEPLASSWMSLRLSDSSRIGIGIDLSLHKKMGKDLAKFAAAVEQAGDGIALIGANGVIEYINPALEEMTGYTLDEATGMHIRCLTGDLADEEHCEEMCDPVSTLETTWRGRRERKRKNGEAYEASLSVTPVRDKSGRIVNYAAIVRDVTREVRLQQQLLHAHKMEELLL
ncbi:MAG TPA: PAS domain S-box protein, partial [Deltaproteobacteria bacterium]|nr:PAS domain S-box protein [Deltaproteobacteria bacterium]